MKLSFQPKQQAFKMATSAVIQPIINFSYNQFSRLGTMGINSVFIPFFFILNLIV